MSGVPGPQLSANDSPAFASRAPSPTADFGGAIFFSRQRVVSSGDATSGARLRSSFRKLAVALQLTARELLEAIS